MVPEFCCERGRKGNEEKTRRRDEFSAENGKHCHWMRTEKKCMMQLTDIFNTERTEKKFFSTTEGAAERKERLMILNEAA